LSRLAFCSVVSPAWGALKDDPIAARVAVSGSTDSSTAAVGAAGATVWAGLSTPASRATGINPHAQRQECEGLEQAVVHGLRTCCR